MYICFCYCCVVFQNPFLFLRVLLIVLFRERESSSRRKLELFFNIENGVLSLLYVMQLAIGYFLMLIVMSMNLGLILSVFFGAFIGHMFFKRQNATQASHCHN